MDMQDKWPMRSMRSRLDCSGGKSRWLGDTGRSFHSGRSLHSVRSPRQLAGKFILLILSLIVGVGASWTRCESSFGQSSNRWALVIGIDEYFDLLPLDSSSSDAIQFGDVLVDRCGFAPRQVSIVVDQPKVPIKKAHLKLRFSPLRAHIKNFIRMAEADGAQMLVVYYSGHGCAVHGDDDSVTDLMLPAIDASESDGELTNSLSRNELSAMLANANIAQKLLVLDCCHAAQADQIPLPGKGIQLKVRKPTDENDSGDGTAANHAADTSFAILAGSAFDQIAAEQVFTRHIVDGLGVLGDTAQDRDNSQQIELNELFQHVRRAMSSAGGQRPSLEVLSGSANDIRLAAAVMQPDPQRVARVHVYSQGKEKLSGVKVKLSFSDTDQESVTLLAEGVTNSRGMARLRYRFGDTKERNGRFQISLIPDEQFASSMVSLSKFANGASPVDYAFELSPALTRGKTIVSKKIPTPATKPRVETSHHQEKSVFEKSVEKAAEFSHRQVLDAIVEYTKTNKDVPDVCTFKNRFPSYRRLIDTLRTSEKFQIGGAVICFPSKETWSKKPQLRNDIVRILKAENVLNANSRRTSTQRHAGGKEPSFEKVKGAAFDYVRRVEVDVCGLKELVPGYREMIERLKKSEKFEVFPGLPICFPSEATWKAKPQYRKDFIGLLRATTILEE